MYAVSQLGVTGRDISRSFNPEVRVTGKCGVEWNGMEWNGVGWSGVE